MLLFFEPRTGLSFDWQCNVRPRLVFVTFRQTRKRDKRCRAELDKPSQLGGTEWFEDFEDQVGVQTVVLWGFDFLRYTALPVSAGGTQ